MNYVSLLLRRAMTTLCMVMTPLLSTSPSDAAGLTRPDTVQNVGIVNFTAYSHKGDELCVGVKAQQEMGVRHTRTGQPLQIQALQRLAQTPAPPPTTDNATTKKAAPTPLRIVIIGDSTVSEYAAKRPLRGWGMFVQECFKDGTVKVSNLAKSGRSSKTYIQGGRWKKALEEEPNYVLIQFGHNDSHAPGQPESTDAATDFKEYLRRYIDESRAVNATPILVTPMVRRTFDAEGKLLDGLARYADAMKEVGAEKKVAVIDLHASSKKLVEELGPQKSAEMVDKKSDATHFNEKGARAMADLVMKELPTAEPKLKNYLKDP